MNRRNTIRAALALAVSAPLTKTFANSLLTPAANRLNRGLTTIKRAKVFLRGEPKQSDSAPAGAFAKREVDGLLFLTNAYGYSYEIPLDSYIEWHLDGANTTMNFRCVNSDQYRVKAFPCAVLGTMGGRWETSGTVNPLPGMDGEFRMKGEGMQTPIFDMNPAKQKTGFPCKLADLPKTDLSVVTSYSGNPTVNTFLDMYLHDIDNPKTACHASLVGDINAINSNRTKAYNINVWFQMPDHRNGNSDRPDGAWAGGKVIGTTDIAGRSFHVILKIETGGGNYFRYIALIPVDGPITSLSINSVMEWARTSMRPLLENNGEAGKMMAKADPRGYSAPRWPDKNMVLSGLHIGNEIWWSDPNGQEGIVNWPTLRVDVENHGSFGWGDKQTAGLQTQQRTVAKLDTTNHSQASDDSAISLDPMDAKYAWEDQAEQSASANLPEEKKSGGLKSFLKSIFK